MFGASPLSPPEAPASGGAFLKRKAVSARQDRVAKAVDQVLKGQVALVTGASGGLGEHFARLLAHHGATVALAARRLDRVEALARELRAEGAVVLPLELDVTQTASIKAAANRVQGELGPISILVNNSGVTGDGAALTVSEVDWDNTFAVNVRGAFFMAREAAQQMIFAKVEGRIVNVASIASHTVLPGLAAYCASKAAVAMLTKSLAREWARYGIAVNALCPGYVATELNNDWWPTEGGRAQIKRFPRRRLMEAGDLDSALLLLAGPGAHAITGSSLTIDDGQSLPGGG
jgi:NAD(P)-dependent dehydrogenase (short-subunit alcohol dehydrogenase family)